MWWPIIENMRDFFRNHDALTGVAVDVAEAVQSVYPAILISGTQFEEGMPGLKRGKVGLLLAEYVESIDSDLAGGYAELHQLQDKRERALAAWQREHQLPVAVKIISQKMIRDSNVMPPVYGNKTVLELEWKA